MVYDKKDCFLIKQYDGTISPKTYKEFPNKTTSNRVKKICNNKFRKTKCVNTICETLASDPNMNPLTMKPFKPNEQNLKERLISECQNYSPKNACECIFSPSEKRKIIDACIQLSQNPNINPYTGKKIKIGSKTFNNLKYTCDICEKPIDVNQILAEVPNQPAPIEPSPIQQNIDSQQYASQIETLNSQIDQLIQERDEQSRIIDELQNKVIDSQNANDEINSRLITLRKQQRMFIDALDKSENETIPQLQEELKRQSDELQNRIADTEIIEQKNTQIDTLKRRYKRLISKIVKYDTETIPQLQEELKRQTDSCKMKTDDLLQEISKYRGDLESTNNLIDRLQERINLLEQAPQYDNSEEFNELQNEYETLQSQYDDLQDRTNDMISKYETLLNDYEILKEDLSSRGQEMSPSQNEEYNILKEYYDQLLEDNDNLNKKYEETVAELEQARNMYFELADEYEKYIDECEDIRNKYETYTANLEELQEKFDQQERVLLDKEDLMQFIREQKEKAEDELVKLKEKYSPEQMERFLEALDAEYNKRASSEISKNLDTIARLNRENEILIQELDSLRISAGTSDERQLIAEIQELLKQIGSLNKDINYLESEIKQLKLDKEKIEDSYRKYSDMLYTILDKLNGITRQMGLTDISNPVEIIDRLDEIDRYILELRVQNQSYNEYIAFGGESNSKAEKYENALYVILRRLNEIIIENNLPVEPLENISDILDGIDAISKVRNKPKSVQSEISDLSRLVEQQNARMGGSRSQVSSPSFGGELPEQMSQLSDLVGRTSRRLRQSK